MFIHLRIIVSFIKECHRRLEVSGTGSVVVLFLIF